MAFKIMIDANVLLDFTLKREFYEDAKKILQLAVDGDVRAYTTPSIIHICGYWLSKAYGRQQAKKLLLTLLADVTVIDITHEVALAALHSKINNIEDALQYYTAINHKIGYFISRDKPLKNNSMPTLSVYTPREFIEALFQ